MINFIPDRTGSGPTETDTQAELKRKLREMSISDLADYLHAHEEDETTPEFKACQAEIKRRDDIYHGKHMDDLGEQA